MLHITSLFAGLLGFLIIFLAYKVVAFRQNKKVGIGDAGHKDGILVIRTHANALEYIPMFLILMGLYESNGGSPMVLYIVGSVMVVARLLHAMGLSKTAGTSFGRFYGTLFTWIMILTLSGLNIYRFVLQM